MATVFTVFGQITVLLTLRPEDSITDHLFIATERYDYFTVSWDREKRTIRNERPARDFSDRFLRSADYGAKYISDPQSRMLGLHIYQGIFTIIPLIQQPGKTGKKGQKAKSLAPGELVGDMCEPSPIRLQELRVLDIVFLDTPETTVAMLYEDGLNKVHLQIYKVKAPGKGPRGGLVRDAELEEIDIDQFDGRNLDPFSKFIIPVPASTGMRLGFLRAWCGYARLTNLSIGGMLILGEQTIAYISASGKLKKQSLTDPTVFSTWGRVNDTRYLLGDDYGKLYSLILDVLEIQGQVDIIVTYIGEVRRLLSLPTLI